MTRAVGQLVPTGCLALGPTCAAQIEATGTPLGGLCWWLGLQLLPQLGPGFSPFKILQAVQCSQKKKKNPLRKQGLSQSLAPSTAI